MRGTMTPQDWRHEPIRGIANQVVSRCVDKGSQRIAGQFIPGRDSLWPRERKNYCQSLLVGPHANESFPRVREADAAETLKMLPFLDAVCMKMKLLSEVGEQARNPLPATSSVYLVRVPYW
jgi:hypothetical protein